MEEKISADPKGEEKKKGKERLKGSGKRIKRRKEFAGRGATRGRSWRERGRKP